MHEKQLVSMVFTQNGTKIHNAPIGSSCQQHVGKIAQTLSCRLKMKIIQKEDFFCHVPTSIFVVVFYSIRVNPWHLLFDVVLVTAWGRLQSTALQTCLKSMTNRTQCVILLSDRIYWLWQTLSWCASEKGRSLLANVWHQMLKTNHFPTYTSIQKIKTFRPLKNFVYYDLYIKRVCN